MEPSTSTPEPLLVSVRAAASLLSVSISAIRRWTADGTTDQPATLPSLRLGGKRLIERSALDTLIDQAKQENQARLAKKQGR